MRTLWLLFAQVVTAGLAIYMVVAAVRGPREPSRLQSGTVERPAAILQAPAGATPAFSYREAAARAMPAVVNILTSKVVRPRRFLEDPFFRRFFGDRVPEEEQQSLGSGVIVSPDGYILTNNHVVEAADDIQVILADGRKAGAKIVGTDPETDLAVIRVALRDLPVIVLGHSDEARVGDVVLAIGNPFGVGQTVTMGIISALGRKNLHINPFENFIQTDAAINFGNSGGALIDTGGNLIGINSAIYSQSGGSVGIGFAIPTSTAKSVMEAIIKTGYVVRGWIGIESQDITPELAENFGLAARSGVIIAGVVRNGPADRAGLRPGDILLSINQQPVADTAGMLTQIAALSPGTAATMTVLRKNQRAQLSVQVALRPRSPTE
ncbi:trypsin-like peptidase domain-containing protein [Massilia sp. TS11]|uniref:trypsin-like peptidase domain-containing protein n=1 Tax=Massilia sp. TS11 TaxID=2908003 RepID=UPI001EDC8142|nr:trypsin-like peptidase domain-containing protein [Massilia sp. TS11]MCG2585843.1 trypsin-like peptidase domain-containing protein [Massilia sp. TS11]